VTAASLLGLSACSGANSTADPAPESASASAAPAPEGTSASPEVTQQTLSLEDTKRQFLSIVCYTDTSLQNLNGAALNSGGWSGIPRKEAATYAEAAIDAAREAVRRMQEADWPDSVASQLPAMESEYLAMLRPLEQIAQASKADDRSQAWRELKSQDRTAEQQVRLTLGLGPVDSTDDGCPPPVEINAPKKDKKDKTDSNAAAGWTDHWTSPSGNIECGYNPAGSRGLPVVACVVSDEHTYMKLTQGVGVEGPLGANSGTYAQLSVSGARVLGYGQTTYVGPFACNQSLTDGIGMSCWLTSTLQGFTVKRGTYWSY